MRIKHFYYRVVLSLSLTSAGARPLLGVTLLRPARGWYDKTVTASGTHAIPILVENGFDVVLYFTGLHVNTDIPGTGRKVSL